MLCATFVKHFGALDQWGIHNGLCVLLIQVAPVEDATQVVMSKFEAVLYYLSNEMNATVSSILCKIANWQMAFELIARDG